MKKKHSLNLRKGEKLVKGPGGKMGIWRSLNGNPVFLPDGEDPKKVIADDIARAAAKANPRAGIVGRRAVGRINIENLRSGTPTRGPGSDSTKKAGSRSGAEAIRREIARQPAPKGVGRVYPEGVERMSAVDPDPDYTPEARKRSASASRARGRAMQSGPESLSKWAKENDGWEVSRTAAFGTALRMQSGDVTYTLYRDDTSSGMGWIVHTLTTPSDGGPKKKGYLTLVNKPHTFEQALKLIDGHKNPSGDGGARVSRNLGAEMFESGITDPVMRDFLLLEAEPTGRSACRTCRHWGGGDTCRAFPDGIPADIAEGRNDHTDPYPGDGGMQYAPKDDESMDDSIDTEMDD